MSSFAYFPGPNPYLPPKKSGFYLISFSEIHPHFTSYQKKNQLNFYHNYTFFSPSGKSLQSNIVQMSHGFEMSNDISR